VAGGAHHLPGQHHRAAPDGAQRPRRHEVRHPLPGLLPRLLRHAGRQRARGAPRPRRLRLVRHPILDRRLGHLQDPRGLLRPRWSARRCCRCWASSLPQLVVLPLVLGAQPLRHPARHRVDSGAPQHQGPAAHRAGPRPAHLGVPARGGLRLDARAALGLRGGQPKRASSGASSSRRSRAWWASGPRSRSTSPTSPATPTRSATRCGDRPSACPPRWASTRSSASPSPRPRWSSTARPSGTRWCWSPAFADPVVLVVALALRCASPPWPPTSPPTW
jgi:hypothetical protein